MDHGVRLVRWQSARTNGRFVRRMFSAFWRTSRPMVKYISSTLGRSSITRASSFFEIPNLTEKDALIYLTQRRNLSDDMAKNVYSVFGGRLKSLQNAATKIESGVPFSSECIFHSPLIWVCAFVGVVLLQRSARVPCTTSCVVSRNSDAERTAKKKLLSSTFSVVSCTSRS